MEALNFRLATPEDAAAIAQVHVASWRSTYRGIVPHPYLDLLDEGEFTERWKDWLVSEETVSLLVAEAGNRVCGFAAGGPIRKPISCYDGEVYAIYLMQPNQRKGIGRELFVRVAGVLAARGMQGLLVWVLRENPATEFYARLGGEVVAEETIEIGGATLPEIAYGWSDFAATISR